MASTIEEKLGEISGMLSQIVPEIAEMREQLSGHSSKIVISETRINALDASFVALSKSVKEAWELIRDIANTAKALESSFNSISASLSLHITDDVADKKEKENKRWELVIKIAGALISAISGVALVKLGLV